MTSSLSSDILLLVDWLLDLMDSVNGNQSDALLAVPDTADSLLNVIFMQFS